MSVKSCSWISFSDAVSSQKKLFVSSVSIIYKDRAVSSDPT